MKYIKIVERLAPYSHFPGSSCILPGTPYQVQVFPTRLRIYSLLTSAAKLIVELIFDLQGPLEGFTIQNDLEKGEIRVWGKASSGFVRYHLKSHFDRRGISINFDKTPAGGIKIFQGGNCRILNSGEAFPLFSEDPCQSGDFFQPPVLERLSLGNHKAQDWELVRRRLDLTEIMPIWHRLGLLVQASSYHEQAGGNLDLLHACIQGVKIGQPEKLVKLWTNLYCAGMFDIMVPRLFDDQFQGIGDNLSTLNEMASPLILLIESAKLIRELFIQADGPSLKLLPALPPEFHCGRFIHIPFKYGKISMEWTKKIIRRLEVYMEEDAEITFYFRHVKDYRLRKNMKDKGVRIRSAAPILLEKKTLHFFDNFQ